MDEPHICGWMDIVTLPIVEKEALKREKKSKERI